MSFASVRRTPPAGLDILCTNVQLTGGTSDTFGSWTELVSATSREYASVALNWCFAPRSRSVLEIAIGPSGGEIVIAQMVSFTSTNDTADATADIGVRRLLIALPRGVRIAARVKGSQNSTLSNISLYGCDYASDNFVGYSQVLAYGITAGPLGTQTTSSTTNNVFGSWTEIIPATTLPAYAISFTVGDTRGYVPENLAWGDIEIGIGVAGVEQTIYGELIAARRNDWPKCHWLNAITPMYIPAGSRIAARMRRSDNNAASLDTIVYLFH